MEVDGLGRLAVEPPLCLGQGPEGGEGPAVHPVGELGGGHDGGDLGGGARRRVDLGAHVDLGAGDARPQHGLGLEGPAVDRQALEHGAHLVDVGPGVDQRAEGHVAGDAGEAVEPGDRGARSPAGRHGDALPGDGPVVVEVVVVAVVVRVVVIVWS